MNWARATTTIADITEGWTVEDGPGGAIVLFDARRAHIEAAGGLADLSQERRFTPHTPIRLASVSKQFLASLMLGDVPVRLDHTLGQHLMLEPALGAVPVSRALDMTGGLPDLIETLWLLGIAPSTSMSRHRLMDVAVRLDRLNFEPGTQICYSNTGYRLVQAALLAHGVDYVTLLQEQLLRPLGLDFTFPEDASVPVRGLATGYGRAPTGNWRAGSYGMHFSASGGMTGSAVDLARWGQALLANQTPVAGLLEQLSAPRLLSNGRPTDYGLGLQRSEFDGRTLAGHGGSLPGYRSHILLDPVAQAGVVVLCNREDVDAGRLALELLADLHNVEPPKPADWLLPEGLFVAESGPFWLHHHAGQVSFMGATELVYDDDMTGIARSRNAALPMQLRAADDGIVGEIGHVSRSFHPVPPRAPANPIWAGSYAVHFAGGTMQVEVVISRGQARMLMPPLGVALDLRPLDANRAVAQHSEGSWTQSFCASFENGQLHLASQRARTLTLNAV